MGNFQVRSDRYEPGMFYPCFHSESGLVLWIGVGGDTMDGCAEQIENSKFKGKP